jgi:hypothetical protein
VLSADAHPAAFTPTRPFLYSGRATFSVWNAAGDRLTFIVCYQPPEGDFGEAYFAYLDPHHGNERKGLIYLGKLSAPDRPKLALWETRKSPTTDREMEIRVFRGVLAIIQGDTPPPEGVWFSHFGKCSACGRKLTDPESVARGLGPDCWERHHGG